MASRSSTKVGFGNARLPSVKLAQMQSEWLEGARSRLLRLAKIQQSSEILDLGCGWGQTTLELGKRCQARVTGIDLDDNALDYARSSTPRSLQDQVKFVLADAAQLPFDDHSMDIIFSQFSFLWFREVDDVLIECKRLLKQSGSLVMIEPDYGGLMEYPAQIACREIWIETIKQAGGDPYIGRSLSFRCHSAGLESQAYFSDRYVTPHPGYLDFLKELPATTEQRLRLDEIESSLKTLGKNELTVQLPLWMYIAKVSTIVFPADSQNGSLIVEES